MARANEAETGRKTRTTMALSKDVFRKIAQASASTGGNWIKQGKYIFETKKLIGEVKQGGPTFIAELVVVSAEPVTDVETPNAVGSTASYVQLLEKHKSAMGNAKAFLLALDGKEESEVGEEEFVRMLEFYTNSDPKLTMVENGQTFTVSVNPAKGMRIACETYRQEKRTKPGEIMTLPRWSTVPQTDEEIAARRQAQAG
jgi:hypothetical protein